jgi:hypothetical protein
MRRRFRCSLSVCAILFPLLAPLAYADDPGSADESKSEGLKIVDTHNVTIVAKNISQEDESGDSQFGIGLDWQYAFERQVPRADDPTAAADNPFENCDNTTWVSSFAFDASASGKGFASLGDPHTNREEAKDASNFNSITNRFRYAGFFRIIPPCHRVEPPPKNPSEIKAWKERTRAAIRRQVEQDAEGYTALDFGFHAETESNQTFADTQVALGGSATLASGFMTQYALYPLKFLVPARDEYGDVVQSPQLFLGLEEVLGASHRKEIDGANDASFTRFRLELGWTSELFIDGLYPFVRYHHYQDLEAEGAIRRAGKASADFYELGANYYVGDRIEPLRKALGENEPLGDLVRNAKGLSGMFSQGKGPFVTVRYAAGELPPYLETDHQVSLGLGIVF